MDFLNQRSLNILVKKKKGMKNKGKHFIFLCYLHIFNKINIKVSNFGCTDSPDEEEASEIVWEATSKASWDFCSEKQLQGRGKKLLHFVTGNSWSDS